MKGSVFCSCLGIPSQHAKEISAGCPGATDLEVLVGSLLPLARHGVWWRLGEHAHGSEDGQGGTEAGEDIK